MHECLDVTLLTELLPELLTELLTELLSKQPELQPETKVAIAAWILALCSLCLGLP